MNGFRPKGWLAAALVAGSAAASGCYDYSYNDLVDPCWPQRYNCMARNAVNQPFAIQAGNGLALEQTVWNHHFYTDKDGTPTSVLTQAGQAHLDYLVRRRPCPMGDIFLQTAHDHRYLGDRPEQFIADRAELDARRIKAVTDYLAAARPDVPFQVAVHDPAPVGIHGREAARAVANMHFSSVGNLPYGSFGENVPVNGNDREQFGPAGGTGPSGQTGPAAGPGGFATASAEQAAYNTATTAVVDQTVRSGGPVPAGGPSNVPPVPPPAPMP
jgi:hypothetical protein